MPVLTTDCHKLILAYSVAGQYMENVMHFAQSSTGSMTPEQDSADLVAGFQASVYPQYILCMALDALLLGIRAQRVNNTGGPSYLAPAVPGSHGGQSLACSNPRDCALLMNDYFDDGGTPTKWRNGKIYFGALPQDAMLGGNWRASFQTAIVGLCTAINTGFTGTAITWRSVIWSPKRSGFWDVQNWELDVIMASQAKRTRPHV